MAFGDGLSEGFDWSALEGIDWEDVNFKKAVQERFPSWAWAIDHPELGPIIRRAAGDENWSVDLFESQIEASDWYTERTEAQRAWDVWWESTPEEEKRRRIEEQQGTLIDIKAKLGVELTAQEMYDLTVEGLRNGWNEDELVGKILATSSGRELGVGSIQGNMEYVQEAASRNYVTVDDATARQWADRIARGEMTTADLDQYVKQLAKAKFAGNESVQAAIDLGMNVWDMFADHRSVIGSMLGMSSEQVDLLNDTRFSKVLTQPDMTVADTASMVRNMDEYWQLPGGEGQNKLYSLTNSLRRAMGASR